MSFLTHTSENVLWMSSSLLDGSGVRHGFSTRIGGVSPAPWDSLNLGVGRGDDMDRVRENYRRFCAALGVDEHRAVLSKQVHEDNVRHVTAEDCGKGLFRTGTIPAWTPWSRTPRGSPWWCSPPTAASSCSTHPVKRGRGRGPCRLAGRRRRHRIQNRPPDAGAVRHGPRGPAGRHRGGHRPLLLRDGRRRAPGSGGRPGGGGGAVYHPPGAQVARGPEGRQRPVAGKRPGCGKSTCPRTAPPAIRSCTGPTGGWARPGALRSP